MSQGSLQSSVYIISKLCLNLLKESIERRTRLQIPPTPTQNYLFRIHQVLQQKCAKSRFK